MHIFWIRSMPCMDLGSLCARSCDKVRGYQYEEEVLLMSERVCTVFLGSPTLLDRCRKSPFLRSELNISWFLDRSHNVSCHVVSAVFGYEQCNSECGRFEASRSDVKRREATNGGFQAGPIHLDAFSDVVAHRI
jgi:hypothetical protein